MERDEQLDLIEERVEEDEFGKETVDDRDLGELGWVLSLPGDAGSGRERRDDLLVLDRGRERDVQRERLELLDGDPSARLTMGMAALPTDATWRRG